MPASLSDIMRSLTVASAQPEPALKFEVKDAGNFLFIGYTADEVVELFKAYREHQTLMLDLMQRADAVHYVPQEGRPVNLDFGGLDDARPHSDG